MDSKVAVYTRVYNTKPYLKQCIESVLNQTYSNFIYIIVDNGCTDGSSEIIEEYAKKDSRVRRVRFEKNGSVRTAEQINKFDDPEIEYITILDSDDWWEPSFLECTLKLALETKSDIVATGTFMHILENGQIMERKIERSLILSSRQYAEAFTFYHSFFRTIWAKLIKKELYLNMPQLAPGTISYGADTISAFNCLRKANRICIDSSMLHHYRIHKKSTSYKYNPKQSFSDLYLFNDAVDFLSGFGPISRRNMAFLYTVYANAIKDTAVNLVNSSLSAAEKMHEFNKILLRQVTKKAYAENMDEIRASREQLLSGVFICACELSEENDDFKAILEAHLPKCAAAVTVKNLGLFRLEKGYFDALTDDDGERLVKMFLEMISKPKYAEYYNRISEVLRGLSRDNPLLGELDDVDFLRRFGNIYLMIYRGGDAYGEALDAMTDILLKEPPSSETFMFLYISLAAMLECVDEFIFGKIKLALFYVNAKRFDECRAVLDEISEMGVEDNDEIISIKAGLQY